MSQARQKGDRKTKWIVLAALCLALAAIPLAACSGQQDAGGAPEGGDASAPAAPADQAAPAGQAAVDPSSWTTVGDALAARTDECASSWDENYYVAVFKAGDSYMRIVGTIDPDTQAKIDAVDWDRKDVSTQIDEAVSGAALKSAEDITGDILSQDALDALVGKTGQQLVDEGWEFQSYFMYGGEQTIATFANGNFAYSMTFDVTTPESASEDEGASVMAAPVVSAEFEGASNATVDPTLVK